MGIHESRQAVRWSAHAAYPPTAMADTSPVRLQRWFDELAAIGHTDSGWNRVAWTPLEAEARAWFTEVAEGLGLRVQRDGAGTLWAVTEDADDGPWVCVGSHLDTQPDGGAYDGALGIVCGLEAAAAVIESGVPRRHPLAVVAFVDEEGARFRVPCFASLAITGRPGRRPGAGGDGRRAGDLRRHARVAAGGAAAALPRALVHGGPRRAGASTGRPQPGPRASPPSWHRASAGGSSSAARPTTPGRRRWTGAATRWWQPPGSCWRRSGRRPCAGRGGDGRAHRGAPGIDELDPRRRRPVAGCPGPGRGDAGRIGRLAARGARDANFTREARNDGAAFDAELRDAAARRRRPRGIAVRRSALLRRP